MDRMKATDAGQVAVKNRLHSTQHQTQFLTLYKNQPPLATPHLLLDGAAHIAQHAHSDLAHLPLLQGAMAGCRRGRRGVSSCYIFLHLPTLLCRCTSTARRHAVPAWSPTQEPHPPGAAPGPSAAPGRSAPCTWRTGGRTSTSLRPAGVECTCRAECKVRGGMASWGVIEWCTARQEAELQATGAQCSQCSNAHCRNLGQRRTMQPAVYLRV